MEILIAEDDFTSRNSLKSLLEKLGHQIIETTNGLEAWEVLQRQDAPAMAILDWMMPEMDGLALCEAIRKKNNEKYVFIILLSSRSSTQDIVKGLEAGADDFLIKPPHPSELAARIKNGFRILELERKLRKANEDLRVLSITDPLTGVYNRGYITEHLPREITRAKRYKHPVSLLMCDIDHFKSINDSFGHRVGDQVIIKFIQMFSGLLRKNIDWIARYGGEEFLIVLPEIDCQGAQIVAERLRKRLYNQNLIVDRNEIQVTVSIGVTDYYPLKHGENIFFEQLIGFADQAMYRAKEKGRNRVITRDIGTAQVSQGSQGCFDVLFCDVK